jgi:hypothetical protein
VRQCEVKAAGRSDLRHRFLLQPVAASSEPEAVPRALGQVTFLWKIIERHVEDLPSSGPDVPLIVRRWLRKRACHARLSRSRAGRGGRGALDIFGMSPSSVHNLRNKERRLADRLP